MNTVGSLACVGHLTQDDIVIWNGDSYFTTLGGAALYAALGASIAGAAATVISAVGSNASDAEFERLRDYEIAFRTTPYPGRGISQWVLYEEDGSREYRLHPDSGSLDALAPVPASFPEQLPVNAIHVAPMPLERQADWVSFARQHGLFVSLDPHHDDSAARPDEVLALAAEVDLFLPSALESRSLTGAGPRESLDELRDLGIPAVVVKDGEHGCLVASGDDAWHVPAAGDTVFVDPTGAGDSFCGAMLARIVAGDRLPDAAARACAAASIVVESIASRLPDSEIARERAQQRAAALRAEPLPVPHRL
ncbi:carbohydrate kinase family protein [Microbacterium sp.]|uniref:carbohydrate kinase family protein n=1 Tax=Microbacterium sp. TaxID=51671 RepID=UPI003A91019F